MRVDQRWHDKVWRFPRVKGSVHPYFSSKVFDYLNLLLWSWRHRLGVCHLLIPISWTFWRWCDRSRHVWTALDAQGLSHSTIFALPALNTWHKALILSVVDIILIYRWNYGNSAFLLHWFKLIDLKGFLLLLGFWRDQFPRPLPDNRLILLPAHHVSNISSLTHRPLLANNWISPCLQRGFIQDHIDVSFCGRFSSRDALIWESSTRQLARHPGRFRDLDATWRLRFMAAIINLL